MAQFSTSPQPEAKDENYFLSQPHQPFFVAGIVWAIIVMLVFMASYKLMLKGSLESYLAPLTFHAYTLIFIVFTQFFIGFLYTTFSRFCQAPPVKKPYYLRTFFLYQIASLMIVVGYFTSEAIMFSGMFVLLSGQIVFLFMLQRIFTSSQPALRDDPFWILTSLYIGTIAHAIWIIELIFHWQEYALPFAFNLYLIFMTFSVAQRMVPFFSHSMAEKNPRFVAIVFASFIFKSFATVLDFPLVDAAISLFLGNFILREVLSWNLSFKNAPNILKILHIALYWMPAALIIGAIFTLGEILFQTSFVFAEIHLLALGFLTTIIIGFGTRVTLGHSGQPPHADALTLKLFYLTQIVVGLRLLYSIVFGFNLPMMWMFDVSLTLWLVLFGFWGWKFAPVLIFKKKESNS